MSTENASTEVYTYGRKLERHVCATTRQSSLDLIKEEPEIEKPVTAPTVVEMEEDYLKVKEKPPPGINASLVLWYAVMFLMFSVGWVSFNRCPLNRMIPIYLIVAGSLGASAKFLSKTESTFALNISIFLVFCYVIWTFLGSYWVYKEYQPNYTEPGSSKYCNRAVYLFSFWWLTLQYTLIGFYFLLGFCYMLMRNGFSKF